MSPAMSFTGVASSQLQAAADVFAFDMLSETAFDPTWPGWCSWHRLDALS